MHSTKACSKREGQGNKLPVCSRHKHPQVQALGVGPSSQTTAHPEKGKMEKGKRKGRKPHPTTATVHKAHGQCSTTAALVCKEMRHTNMTGGRCELGGVGVYERNTLSHTAKRRGREGCSSSSRLTPSVHRPTSCDQWGGRRSWHPGLPCSQRQWTCQRWPCL